MSTNVLENEVYVEEGNEFCDEFNLNVPDHEGNVDRKIDKLLDQIRDDLQELAELANKHDAESVQEALKKHRKEFGELEKKTQKGKKKEAKLIDEAVPLLLKIRAELSVPVRE